MKSNPVFMFALMLVVLLNACSPFVITESSGEQPTPVVETLPATELPAIGYEPVQVNQVQVEIGVGSPIPVQVMVSGNLPDTCAQIELLQQKQFGSNFEITLSTVPSNAEECIQDSLPFQMMIPLNITNLPAGSYSVEVSGVPASFQLETGNTTSSQPTAELGITKDDIEVPNVAVEVGVGSPIPVRAIVDVNLPNSCAQLGEMRLHREGTTFYVRLIADVTGRPDCRVDSIPFRLEIPLNIVNLPEGPYEINVNGATASFDPRSKPLIQACTEPVQVPVVDGQAAYNGISFRMDPLLANVLAAHTCPATTAEEQQMVNDAHPPFTEFTFPDYSRQNTDYQPSIRVYELTGDLENFLYPINVIEDLRSNIEQRPEPATWFQHSPLHTRQAYLDFASGSGVRGLVQYMQDFFFFTNNGLIYEFYGLTDDGRHLVHVRYPVSVPFLMELDGFSLPPVNLNPQAISIPEWPSDFEAQRQVIEAYNTEALQRFEQMSDSEVSPDLALLDQLVQSIQVRQP
jgi:hypothetical protein